MRLNSQSNQFIFNLPSSFVSNELIERYKPLLEKNWVQYENVLDYLNSTIKGVNFPGVSIDLPKQLMVRGKERYQKPAKNLQDITTSKDLTVTFRSVDSDLNYWIIFDIFTKHYIDVDHLFLIDPFKITCVDVNRDGIYQIYFYEIILKSLSDNTFNYSQQKVNAKEFTMTFHYNFYEVDLLLDQSKIIETGLYPGIFNLDRDEMKPHDGKLVNNRIIDLGFRNMPKN